MKLSLVGKLRLKRALKYVGLLVLVAFFVAAVVTNFFGKQAKTAAANVSITSSSRYFLDGWEMSNNNALGRVAPVTNINGSNVTISNNAAVRFDNSKNGYDDNNPLFSTVSGVSTLTPRNSDGKTRLAGLTIAGNSSITNTPLDFLTAYRGTSLDDGYAYGIRYTGYYYNSNSIPDLEFGGSSDDGLSISVYVGNAWMEVYNCYWAHNNYFDENTWVANGTSPTGYRGIRPFNYVGGTYLPVRINYYNEGGASAYSLAIRTSSSPVRWVVPKAGENSIAGRFYTGPDSSTFTEGLVADYFMANSLAKKYVAGDHINRFSTSRSFVWSGSDSDNQNYSIGFYKNTPMNMENFRFSYITQRYYEITTKSGGCDIVSNQIYGTTGEINVDTANCSGHGGPFIKQNGSFANASYDPLRSIELYDIGSSARPDSSAVTTSYEGNNSLDKWRGGRSRLNLEVSGNVVVANNSAIDAKGTGWAPGPCTNDVFNVNTPNTYVFERGLGYGGGWLNYNGTNNNGAAGGGSFGGVGIASENAEFRNLVRHDYGNRRDVEHLGSGGGKTSNEFSNVSGSGGGLIIISASDIQLLTGSKITADGAHAFGTNDGAGSGGGIHLLFTSPKVFSGEKISADGGSTGNSQNYGTGGGGRIWIENASGSTSGITARKGCSVYDSVSGTCSGPTAGGLANMSSYFQTNGSVEIDAKSRSAFSIEKWLEPVSRNSTADTNFNPYALRPNDEILVKMRVENLDTSTIITDVPLSQTIAGTKWVCNPTGSGTIKAQPTDANINIPASTIVSSKVEWNLAGKTIPASGKLIFYYSCKVSYQ